jgi:hypothetical protein
MIFRIRYAAAGGHVHCRLFAGRHEGALGKCGDLVLTIQQFELFRGKPFIEFTEETRSKNDDPSACRV